MDKTPQKVTKNPKRVEAARKGRENYVNKFKESILKDVKKDIRDTRNAGNETTSVTSNTSNETTSGTNTATSTNNTVTTRSNDTYVYVYGVGIFVLAIGFSHIFCIQQEDGTSHPLATYIYPLTTVATGIFFILKA